MNHTGWQLQDCHKNFSDVCGVVAFPDLLGCGAAAAHNNFLSRWPKRVNQQDSRSRPLATSAPRKKSENWFVSRT
jgi:hypothetical protein